MAAAQIEGRWIARSRAAGEGTRALFTPAPGGATFTPADLARRIAATGVDAITLVDSPRDFAVALVELTAAQVDLAGHPDLGPGGPIDLCPDPEPLLLGPAPAAVRSVDVGPMHGDHPPDVLTRLRLIDLALGGRGRALAKDPPQLAHPPLSLCVEASRRINRLCLKFLVQSGGATPRTVLRGGERVRGCLWDRPLKTGFQLRFGVATTHLWSRWAQTPLLNTSRKVRRRRLRNWLPIYDCDTGDWIVFARLRSHLNRIGWTAVASEALDRRCLKLSPLAALAALRVEVDDAAHFLAQLVAPHAVRVVECVDAWLIRQWRQRLSVLTHGNIEPVEIDAATAVIDGWYTVLDAAGRCDLARALMQVTHEWIVRTDAHEVRTRVGRRPDRIVVRAALARLADAAARPVAIRGALMNQRYGDARYAEAQLFLADYDAYFAEAAPIFDHFGRTMRGVIG